MIEANGFHLSEESDERRFRRELRIEREDERTCDIAEAAGCVFAPRMTILSSWYASSHDMHPALVAVSLFVALVAAVNPGTVFSASLSPHSVIMMMPGRVMPMLPFPCFTGPGLYPLTFPSGFQTCLTEDGIQYAAVRSCDIAPLSRAFKPYCHPPVARAESLHRTSASRSSSSS